jgi:GNAT superfamily N-acetyltransferase
VAGLIGNKGESLPCVFLVPGDTERVAKLRILLVDPRARGRDLGSRLVVTAIEFATAAGSPGGSARG